MLLLLATHLSATVMLDSAPEKKWTVTLGLGAVVGVLAVLGLLLIAAKTDPPVTLNLVLVIAGGTLGWTLGILVSPYAPESHTFSEYGKGITTFLSGFGLASVSRIVEYGLNTAQQGKVPGTVLLTRTLLFVGSFFLFVVFLFVVRSYT
jgi:hypothetical protein